MTNKTTDELVSEANQSQLNASTHHDIGGVKKKSNKFQVGILFAFAGVLLLGIMGLKIYNQYFKDEKPVVVETKDANASQVSKQRSGLGQNFDPMEEGTEGVTTSSSSVNSAVEHTANQDIAFKKYLSIPISGGSSARENRQAQETESTNRTEDEKSAPGTGTSLKAGMKVSSITLDPNLFIEANTLIPCALTTRFVSDVAGRISCVITEDIWSANHHVKLIEKGTKAFGSYKSGTLRHGVGRLFVIWEQLRTPDFKRIDLVDTAAAGELGEAGISGWIDTHFADRFLGAILLSTVQDAAAAAADNVSSKDRNVDYTENSRASLAEMAKVALENSINIPPTLYRNQGDIISIVVGDDIDFSGIYQLKAKR